MQRIVSSHLWPGVPLALGSAILFGITAPFSKHLLGGFDPQMLAGVLYLGAGIGLTVVHAARHAFGVPAPEAPLRRSDTPWLIAIVIFGGVLGPLLLMLGLDATSAANGSLLLNLEGLATMAIAWLVFRENVDAHLFVGAGAILLGAMVLSWQGRGFSLDPGALLILSACISWGIDNNLTRKLSSADPVLIALIKGLAAGLVNVALAVSRTGTYPDVIHLASAALLGFLGVGLSLVLFILSLRHLGTARTGAYFSLAPFIGALAAITVLDEAPTWQMFFAGLLMAVGLWLHLSERHHHEHEHATLEHEHRHDHDEHHQHKHDPDVVTPHSHGHLHGSLAHAHAHYPDMHHRHPHPH